MAESSLGDIAPKYGLLAHTHGHTHTAHTQAFSNMFTLINLMHYMNKGVCACAGLVAGLVIIVTTETNKCIQVWGCGTCCKLLLERNNTHTHKASRLRNCSWSTGV